MIRELRGRTGWSPEAYRALWARPGTSFGPFDDLPPHLRAALADAVAREMEERSFTTGDRLHRRVHGPLFRLGSEIAHRGRRLSSRGARWRRAGRNVYLCGRGLCWASERAGRAWLDASRFVGPWETSGFHALWKWAGVDPMRPAIEYVRGVACDPRVSPVYRDPRRRVSSWMMVGLDLLFSDRGVYYIEANINPGFMLRRRVLYPEGDPLLEVLVAGARREGCDRIVMFPSSIAAVSRKVERWWRERTDAAGVELEIRDDPRVRSSWRRATDAIMPADTERTLFVNVRTLPHPVNVLLEEKGRFEEEIERHNARAPAAERIPVPRRIRSSDELPAPDPAGRFPNVVVKHAFLNEARDVRMYRTSTLDSWMSRPPHVAFEFVPAALEPLCRDGVSGDYASKYRVNLFVTPDGPICAGVLKATAATPVTERLDEGLVRNPAPYLVNGHTGAVHELATAEEHERIEPAALRIGWLIHDFLSRLHGVDWP